MADISKIKLSNGDYVDVKDATARASLDNKQDKTDDTLETTSKTIVGAINELKNSGGKSIEVDNDTIKQDTSNKIYATGDFVTSSRELKAKKFGLYYTNTVSSRTNEMIYWGGGSSSTSFTPTLHADFYYSSNLYHFMDLNLAGYSPRLTFGGMHGDWLTINGGQNYYNLTILGENKYSNESLASDPTGWNFLEIIGIGGYASKPTYDILNLKSTDAREQSIIVQYQGPTKLLVYNKEVTEYSDNTNEVVNVAKLNDATNVKLKDNIYPVGSVYTTTSSDILPDLGDTTITWEQIGSIEVNGVNIYFYRRTA